MRTVLLCMRWRLDSKGDPVDQLGGTRFRALGMGKGRRAAELGPLVTARGGQRHRKVVTASCD